MVAEAITGIATVPTFTSFETKRRREAPVLAASVGLAPLFPRVLEASKSLGLRVIAISSHGFVAVPARDPIAVR
jgi:hypothetical protein